MEITVMIVDCARSYLNTCLNQKFTYFAKFVFDVFDYFGIANCIDRCEGKK